MEQNNSKQTSINIVGSGLGGLFAGAILAKRGLKVTVFESRLKIGGYASSWKRKDYTFEASLHEMNGFYPDDRKFKYFSFLGIFDRIKLLKIPSPYTSVFKDYQFTVPHNFHAYVKKLCQEFPHEEKQIKKVMGKLKKISYEALEFTTEKNLFAGFRHLISRYKTIMRVIFKTIYTLVWSKIKDPRLRTIITQLANYYSDDIRKINAIFFSTPTYGYLNEAFWISGTSSKLAEALRDIIEENGGKVLVHHKVTKILFKKKKAVGLIVNNKDEFYSDFTICNSPLTYTVKNLIDKKDIPRSLRKKAIKTKPSTSLFAVYLGLNIDVKDIGIKEYAYIFNFIDDIAELHKDKEPVEHSLRPIYLLSYNLDDSLCKKGKSVVTVVIFDHIDYWEKYLHDKQEYRTEKKRIANMLIDKIENNFPGFKTAIDVMEIGTPVTMERYSNNPGGAVYGASQNIFNGNIFRFPNEIKNRNLYFSGAWVNPGGGFSGVLISAINVSELIFKKLKIDNDLFLHRKRHDHFWVKKHNLKNS